MPSDDSANCGTFCTAASWNCQKAHQIQRWCAFQSFCCVGTLTFHPGKVTHLKVLLDLGDEVTVERYMVVPPAPKMIGAFNFQRSDVMHKIFVFLVLFFLQTQSNF
jgi:hypothetical protein